MKKIHLALIILLVSVTASAQSGLVFGLYTSNLQMPLNDEFYKNPASFSHPLRPSILGIEVGYTIEKKRLSHGLSLQFLTGAYWFSETRTYTRYQGITYLTADRYTRVTGLSLAYSFHIPVIKQVRKQNNPSSNSWFNQLEIFSQTAVDICRLEAESVPAPYDHMYSLEFREFKDARMNIRQLLALQLSKTKSKLPYSIYAGPEYNLFLDGMRGRFGYRLGVSMTFFKFK